MSHVPVLAEEIISLLEIKPGSTYIDGTLGGAGHSKLILEKLQNQGHLYSFDQDREVIERLTNEAKAHANWTLVHNNFAEIYNYAKENQIEITGGILLDLGLSSIQLDDPNRGFSFQRDSQLDMRLNPDADLSADDVVNSYSEKDLADLIYKYGEERKSRQIAATIIKNRPINSTLKLGELIKTIYARGSHGKTFRIHPATQTFQALRIYINRELEVLEEVLELDFSVLKPGAIIAIISFHSLEDRIVKNALRKYAKEGHLEILTKKPIIATDEECKLNPRSRSAKLRVARVK
jgi:16S rRNA (cytosine1402-N4)-methyltransferase